MDSRFPHLPAGRAPGKQSRSRRTDLRFGIVAMWVLGAFFVGLGVYGALDPGEAPPWLFLAIFVPMGVLSAAGALYARRRGRPPVPRHFSVEVATPAVARGESVEARVRVPDAGAVTGRLEVGVVCTEYYDREEVRSTSNGTTRQRVTRDHVAFERWQPVDPRHPLATVRFEIPPDEPFSYEGACLSLAWCVRVREARELRVDPRCDAPFWVTP